MINVSQPECVWASSEASVSLKVASALCAGMMIETEGSGVAALYRTRPGSPDFPVSPD